MINDNDLNRILEAGALAPSGDNLQPWSFKINGEEILIFNKPEKDQSFYNFNQHGSFVSHGCLIENMATAAVHFGYRPEITFSPVAEDKNLIAKMRFIQDSTDETDLYHFIFERRTNRKPYYSKAIGDNHKFEIFKASERFKNPKLFLIENRGSIDKIAEAISVNEKVLLETEKMHEAFFGNIRWDEKEKMSKKDGLYIKTLELAPPAHLFFKLFRHWRLMRLFSALGFPKIVSQENKKTYSSCAAMGAICAEGLNPNDFIESGRLLERIWLIATKLELSLQPLTGVVFLKKRIDAGLKEGLSAQSVGLINSAYATLEEEFKTGGKPIMLVFRIGLAPSPGSTSARSPLDELMSKQNYDRIRQS